MTRYMAHPDGYRARQTGDLFGSGRRATATGTYRRRLGGSVVSNRSPRNVIVANCEQAPFAVHFESPPVGPEVRSVVTHHFHSGVTLRDLIEREGGDHEGT